MSRLSATGAAALALAQETGFAVFPVYEPVRDGGCSCPAGRTCARAAKHPRTPGGFHDATTHPERIVTWWDRWPAANIGLYPGASGCVVVDVDGPEGAAIARRAGAFDVETIEAVTRRGVHRYFRLPVGVTIGNQARRELDVRAHAGYVLAPPSVHASGFIYRWHGALDAIAPAPERLIQALLPPPAPVAPARAPQPIRSALDDLSERRVLRYAERLGYGLSDGRKTGAFRFAAFLAHDVGLSFAVTALLLETWNAQNVPPLGAPLLAEIHMNARRNGGRAGAA